MEIPKRYILCVDDEKLILMSLKAQLKKHFGENYIIEIAENGEDALQIVDEIMNETHDLPVIISDQIMPGMKGDEILIEVRTRLPQTRSIMLTGQANADSVGNALNQAGLYRYISKPWIETDLIMTVQSALKSYYDQIIINKQQRELQELVVKLNEYNENLEKKVVDKTREIEEQKEEITRQRDQLEISNASKDKLFAVLGHDMRNSVSVVNSIANTLYSGYDELENNDRLSGLKKICHASQEMTGLLDHLLDWSRLQAGKVNFSPEVFDVLEMVEEMISFMKTSSDSKRITIKPSVFCKSIVKADRNMIGTVMRNLLTNAIKFSAAGNEIQIHCDVLKNKGKNGVYQITIEDHGIGMDKDRLNSLFNLGKNSSTRGTANEGGTGLGLLICRDYIEINGGEISVVSEKGKGSRFTFSVPAYRQ